MQQHPSITDVLFDVDGVLVHPPFGFRDHLAREHSIMPETTSSFFKGRFHACVMGQAHLRDELEGLVQEWGWTGSVDEFIHAWMREDDLPNAPVLELVTAVRGRGVRCHVASVQERCRAEYIWRNMRFAERFDTRLFSCDLHAAKPDPAFFQRAEELLQRRPEHLLLVDDSEACIAAARERGWSTFHYSGPQDQEALRTVLADIAAGPRTTTDSSIALTAGCPGGTIVTAATKTSIR